MREVKRALYIALSVRIQNNEANGITTTGLGFQKSVAIGLNFLRRVSFALFTPQNQGEIPLEVMVAGFPPRSIVSKRIVVGLKETLL